MHLALLQGVPPGHASFEARVLTFLCGVVLCGWLLWKARQRSLLVSTCALLLTVGLGFILFALFPAVFNNVSYALGVNYPPLLYLIGAVFLLLAIIVHLAHRLALVDQRCRRLAQEFAILPANANRTSSLAVSPGPEARTHPQRPPRHPNPTVDPAPLWRDRLYFGALAFSAIFHVLHALALPIVVTFDGYLYVGLSEVIGTSRFWTAWDWARTPLFPLALKTAFLSFGQQPLAVIALQSALGFMGILCLASTLRELRMPAAGAALALILTFFPFLVTYEHCLLSEAGIFFFLALLVRVITIAPQTASSRRTVLLIVVLAAGYYYRPTIVFLAPAVACIYWFELRRRGLRHRTVALHATAVIVIPFLIAYPWMRQARARGREGVVWMYGLITQAVLPPGDPLLGSFGPVYIEAIRKSGSGGSLPLSGLRWEYTSSPEYHQFVGRSAPRAQKIFMWAAWNHPRRYVEALARGTLLSGGWPDSGSENRIFQSFVVANPATGKLYNPPAGYERFVDRFQQPTRASILGGFIWRLRPIYDVFVPLAFITCTLFAGIGVWQRDLRTVALCIIPLFFCAIHILALQTIDRYAFPSYPLFITAAIACAARQFSRRRLSQRRTATKAS